MLFKGLFSNAKDMNEIVKHRSDPVGRKYMVHVIMQPDRHITPAPVFTVPIGLVSFTLPTGVVVDELQGYFAAIFNYIRNRNNFEGMGGW